MKKNNWRTFPYINAGIAAAILSNPLFYMSLATIAIDVQNLFGATIDRRTAGFNTDMPMIQAMSFVSVLGFILILVGLYLRKNNNKFN